MSAYMIVNVDVTDADAHEEYRRKAPSIVRKHGGEYLARGGRHLCR